MGLLIGDLFKPLDDGGQLGSEVTQYMIEHLWVLGDDRQTVQTPVWVLFRRRAVCQASDEVIRGNWRSVEAIRVYQGKLERSAEEIIGNQR